jgi:hypothetical protein
MPMHVRKKEKIQNFFQTDGKLKKVFGSRLRDGIFKNSFRTLSFRFAQCLLPSAISSYFPPSESFDAVPCCVTLANQSETISPLANFIVRLSAAYFLSI